LIECLKSLIIVQSGSSKLRKARPPSGMLNDLHVNKALLSEQRQTTTVSSRKKKSRGSLQAVKVTDQRNLLNGHAYLADREERLHQYYYLHELSRHLVHVLETISAAGFVAAAIDKDCSKFGSTQ